MIFNPGDRVVINGKAAAKAYASRSVEKMWGGAEMTVVRCIGLFAYLTGFANGQHWLEENPVAFYASALELIDEPVVEEDWS